MIAFCITIIPISTKVVEVTMDNEHNNTFIVRSKSDFIELIKCEDNVTKTIGSIKDIIKSKEQNIEDYKMPGLAVYIPTPNNLSDLKKVFIAMNSKRTQANRLAECGIDTNAKKLL